MNIKEKVMYKYIHVMYMLCTSFTAYVKTVYLI